MILDQTIGAHGAQVEWITFGWGQTWVSGDSAAPVIVDGPFRYIALGTHQPGAKAHGTHQRYHATREVTP